MPPRRKRVESTERMAKHILEAIAARNPTSEKCISEAAESATPLGGEGFVALQSAHAHMVLLEARLAELATAPPAVPLREI